MISMNRALALAALLALAPDAMAQSWSLTPTQDNSIYEPPAGAGSSNGAFEGIFSGNTSFGLARRAFVQFDITGNIPAGATITYAELVLTVTQAPPAAPLHPFDLHRVTSAWGEGASATPPPGGMGAAAIAPDATWANAMAPATPWGVAGGDFLGSSATQMVGTAGAHSWTSAAMVADVQGWLDGTFTNNGWAVLGDEINNTTARRFGSREHVTVTTQPRLIVGWAPPGSSSFCDGSDGSLTSCPCANPGNPDTGCEIQQTTGGVKLEVMCQQTTPSNRVTWRGTAFPTMSSPASIVIRSPSLDTGSPVVFGDGIRCVGAPLVRLAATFANVGTVVHTHGHGAMAGTGAFYYQLWFRNTPIMFCDPAAAFNLSNGHTLIW
jgi:hypothetical protein